MRPEDRVALQWFSVNLLLGCLSKSKDKNLIYIDTSVIVDVGENDLKLTFAVNGSFSNLIDSLKKAVSSLLFASSYKLRAYGHLVKLVTLTFPNLGLFAARSSILNTTSSDDVRSVCVNPIVDTFWNHDRRLIRIRGLEKGDMEMVKERNGPFAGKKINRPVANYDKCHGLTVKFLDSKLAKEEKLLQNFRKIFNALKGRPIFMEGLLLENAFERGLTLPIRGGGVKMKHYSGSLTHACKVPNTEQPFACVDMMYFATLLDKFFGFKRGSILHSPRNIRGMTGDWPLAASFYIYQNGL